MDFVTANHLCERHAQFGSAHRTRQSDHHLSATIEMRDVGIGCVFQHRRVEMPEIAVNELADAAHLQITNFTTGLLLLMQNLVCAGQVLIAFFFKFLTGSRPECAMSKRWASRRAKQLLRQAPRP